jgi:hypothetical protein
VGISHCGVGVRKVFPMLIMGRRVLLNLSHHIVVFVEELGSLLCPELICRVKQPLKVVNGSRVELGLVESRCMWSIGVISFANLQSEALHNIRK